MPEQQQQRIVHCIKLDQDLPGLRKPPLPNELGQRIYENVSQQAFNMFKEHFKMIINEYRLDLTSPQSDKVYEDSLREYFFGEGMKLPDEYVPPTQDKE